MKPAEPRAGRACSACTGFAGRAWRRRAHAGRGARGAAVSYLYLLKFSAPPWWQHNYITAWHDYNCAARMAARRRAGGFWFGGTRVSGYLRLRVNDNDDHPAPLHDTQVVTPVAVPRGLWPHPILHAPRGGAPLARMSITVCSPPHTESPTTHAPPHHARLRRMIVMAPALSRVALATARSQRQPACTRREATAQRGALCAGGSASPQR
jgi:hypothetical protein